MMGQQAATTKMVMMKRTLVLLAAMLAALVAASGVALAVSKVCPTGTTEQNPCSGTSGIDTLIGTGGPDYIRGLAGNDKISAGAGDDTTNGGGGNDTYSYGYGWGTDTLIDSGGSADHLNLSALGEEASLYVHMIPETGNGGVVQANAPGGTTSQVNLPSGGGIEKVTGSAGDDYIVTGGAAHTLRPGPGTGGAFLADVGGNNVHYGGSIPASSDTYAGFAAGGYGEVPIEDWGGAADKLVLPFASTDAYFEGYDSDEDPALDDLLIMTSATDLVYIRGQLEPKYSQKGHIEQIVFTDETITIGSETPQAQTLNGEATTTGSSGVEARVAQLNEASNLDEAEKEKRKKAAQKAIEEAKQHENEQKKGPQGQQQGQQQEQVQQQQPADDGQQR